MSVNSALLISLISVLATRTANLIVHSDHIHSTKSTINLFLKDGQSFKTEYSCRTLVVIFVCVLVGLKCSLCKIILLFFFSFSIQG